MKTYSPKKFYIETYGCQANEADTHKLASMLQTLGMEQITDKEDASLFVINSCSVRQKSEDKVYGLGKIFGGDVKEKPFVVLAGCMVGSVRGERTRYSLESLRKKTPWVDLYLSPEELLQLPNYLVDHGFLTPEEIGFSPAAMLVSNKGFINISYGCDNFCSYCVVPYARGAEISRPEEKILLEIKELLKKGVTQVTLCGQNVNSWGLSPEEKFYVRIGDDAKLPFASLLRKVHSIDGIDRITFISSNPFDFTQDLVDTVGLPKIDNYLHIAVQSGNNDVLSRMNRRHTVEEFIDLVSRIKKVKPDLELGTDIIVGFPGETNEQFMQTVDLFRKIRFNVAFISMYSPRPGTLAAEKYPDDVSLTEKRRRHKVLTQAWKETLGK